MDTRPSCQAGEHHCESLFLDNSSKSYNTVLNCCCWDGLLRYFQRVWLTFVR